MYLFEDYDDNSGTDLTICGDDYRQLIHTCFSYSASFSLCFPSLESADEFAPRAEMLRYAISEHSDPCRRYKCYFPCSDQMKEILLSRANDLFDWIRRDGRENPEDLTFYRDDGSVFFWSETHEGICVLCDRAQEDVSLIVSTNGWKALKEGESVFGVPKCLFAD